MSETLVTESAVRTALRARMLGDVLPAEGRALLQAGHNVAFVASLFPMTNAEVGAALIGRLRLAADLEYDGQVLTFLEHVQKLIAHRHEYRRLRIEWRQTLSMLPVLAGAEVSRSDVEAAVGRVISSRFQGGYENLQRAVIGLAAWVAAGDEAFDGEQLAALYMLAAFWFDVLDFDWVW